MLDLPVYNREGQQVEVLTVDPTRFGTIVRKRLLHQAIVMYQKNRRQGNATTKSRGMVRGSTRKLFRQKGTGRARMGTNRTAIRRGGGVAFAKVPRDMSVKMPIKARRVARDSAILAKMIARELVVIDQLTMDRPRTKDVMSVLKVLNVNGSCLIGLQEYDRNVYLSARNIPTADIMPVEEFNAYAILSHNTLVVTKAGFEKLEALAVGVQASADAAKPEQLNSGTDNR